MNDVGKIVDILGLYGSLLHYALVFFFVGSAFIIFIYLWSKGRLDMDEEPKMRMMQSDDVQPKEEPHE